MTGITPKNGSVRWTGKSIENELQAQLRGKVEIILAGPLIRI